MLAAGLDTGVVVDRMRARRLGRELRRRRALRSALAALRHSDHTAETLGRRLTTRGVAPVERDAVVETMTRAGLLDDARFAQGRATALAARGAGDGLIRDDLERRGVAVDVIADALARLEPETERVRGVVAADGLSARTLRRLAAKGFSPDVLEELVADGVDAELR